MKFNKNSSDLEKKTNDFIQALSDCPEYQSLKKAREEFERDADAKKLLTDFQDAQQTSAIFRQGGFAGASDQEKKFRELQQQLSKNKKINNLIDAQRELQSLVSDIAIEISNKINFPFTPVQRGGCCG